MSLSYRVCTQTWPNCYKKWKKLKYTIPLILVIVETYSSCIKNSFFILYHHPRIDLWQIISTWHVCLLESYCKHNTVPLSNSSLVVPFDCTIILNLYIMAFTLAFILFTHYSRFNLLTYWIRFKEIILRRNYLHFI